MPETADVYRRTRSLCPVCLRTLEADIIREKDGAVRLRRICPEHGLFSGLIWKGDPSFADWSRPKKASASVERETVSHLGCPHDCGRCPEHGQHACTVLFEITERCNLRCPVCFADAGSGVEHPFASLETLTEQLRWIRRRAGEVVLQISGGEPTLHPELPALVRAAAAHFPAVQLNTNGLRLAQRPELAQQLAEAGLSWVFLQFDGTSDDIFLALRGKALLGTKLQAVENCACAGLSVVLVPTVAAGVNDHDLGNLLRLALSLSPTVRGLHLQPMTSSGRNAFADKEPLTLPETLQVICSQSAGLMRVADATPPGCEHERCSFHCRYTISPSGRLLPLRGESCCCSAPATAGTAVAVEPEDAEAGARRAIDVIRRSWQGPGPSPMTETGGSDGLDSFDAFIQQSRARTFSVTCMAFQDVMTVDLDRLQGCCVHVFMPPDRLIPFCACNLTSLDGVPLHRQKQAGAAPAVPLVPRDV